MDLLEQNRQGLGILQKLRNFYFLVGFSGPKIRRRKSLFSAWDTVHCPERRKEKVIKYICGKRKEHNPSLFGGEGLMGQFHHTRQSVNPILRIHWPNCTLRNPQSVYGILTQSVGEEQQGGWAWTPTEPREDGLGSCGGGGDLVHCVVFCSLGHQQVYDGFHDSVFFKPF